MANEAKSPQELKRLDDIVEMFTQAMKERLADQYERGRRGWNDPGWIINGDAKRRILKNVEVGDRQSLADAANLAMFIWWHLGNSTGEERDA